MSERAAAEVSADEVAHSRLDAPLAELSSGIDALYLSGRGDLSQMWLTRLDELREAATDLGGPLPVELEGVLFAVLPHGWGKYRYCLHSPIGRLGFSASRHLPAIRVQPRSELLHALGPKRSVDTFEAITKQLCRGLTFGVSRIDLYADFVGLGVDSVARSSYLCRAKELRTFYEAGSLTGVEFGWRRAATICARVYDKTLDVANKGADWWYEIWGDRFDDGQEVWRVEFELGRKLLTDFGLDGPDAVLDALQSLWAYATGEWLTQREPGADSNRCRWPLSAQWSKVREVRLCQRQVDISRMRSRARAGSLRTLFPGLCGYLASFAAIVGTTDIDDTVDALAGQLRNDEIARRTAFAERVSRRLLEVR